MDSSYEDSDVELEGNFGSASSSATVPGSSDPTTIPLSARLVPIIAEPVSDIKKAAKTVSATGAVGTFHEPLVSLSFDGDLEEDEEEEEEEEDEDEDEDVQLDNTPAEAADRRPQQRTPATTRASPKTWTCKECTFANTAIDSDLCEMCDTSRHPTQLTAAAAPKKETSAANPIPAKETSYKKPEPRPPKKVAAKPAAEIQDEQEDESEDEDDVEEGGRDAEKKDSDEEDELSLDSDREFEMPGFDTVLLPDSQSMMMTATASTLALSATQRTASSAATDKTTRPAATKPQSRGNTRQEESIGDEDDDEDDWPKLSPQIQKKTVSAREEDLLIKNVSVSKEQERKATSDKKGEEANEKAEEKMTTPRLAKRKEKKPKKQASDDEKVNSKQKEKEAKKDEKKNKEENKKGKEEVAAVGSSYDLSFPHWDDEEERMRDREQIKANQQLLDSEANDKKERKERVTAATKASRAENDFMSYARNRKKSLTSPPTTPRSASPVPEATADKKKEKTSDEVKSKKQQQAEKTQKEEKAEVEWITTADKEGRKATPARRTAQRKSRIIQSSSEEDEEEEKPKKAVAKRTKKKKDDEGEKKAFKSSTRVAKRRAATKQSSRHTTKDEWKEDSDEDEADNHDHDNGEDESEEDDEEEERVAKPRASKGTSKGKELADDDKGEKTTRKAKRKSKETQPVPDEDKEAEQFTWRKIEKKMLASGLEAVPPKNADQMFRGFQFIVTGLSPDDDKENEDRSAERINRLVGEEGGKLLSNFVNASLSSQCKKRSGYPGFPSTLLLSSKPRTTLKYLLSVAAGLPTIHYNWLIHCCQQRCLLPHTLYALPAGYSVEKGSDVFIKKPRTDVFESMRVEVVGSPEFKNLWKLVLKEGGAKVVERLFTPQEGRVECIVSPPDPDDYLKVKFKKLRVPVVSKQWIIQSLLSQKMADVEDALYNFKNC